MNEALLHTIWKYKLLQLNQFIGTKNETIEIVSIGEHNQDSGPDFFNSKIKINNLLLAGNVEIHIKTSDWLKHQHQFNKAYDNLILHVVYEHDVELEQNKQFNVSVLELKSYIKPQLIEQYHQLQVSKQKIACGQAINTVPSIVWNLWLDKLAVSRLEKKTNYIEQLFQFAQHNFEETLYLLLFRSFGLKINDEAFELLAKHLSYSIIKKHIGNITQIEALLFGVAGFLDEPLQDAYAKELQNEFEFLKHKYQLVTLQKTIWKFSKTRPSNFPTIRLAQLAQLLNQQTSLFHFIEKQPSIKEIKQFFNITPSNYWQTHYYFDSDEQKLSCKIGELSINNSIINTIVPFLFFMAQHTQQEFYIDYALNLLQALPPEENAKTKPYAQLGMEAKNAMESQAQIYLFDNYCLKKECLKCSVAEFLLKN